MINLSRIALALFLLTLLAASLFFPSVCLSHENGATVAEEEEKLVEEEKKDKIRLKDVLNIRWHNGLEFESLKGFLKFRLAGKVQMDAAGFSLGRTLKEEVREPDGHFEFRRVRVYLDGTVGKRGEFKTEWDITGNDGAVIKDNYWGFRNLPVVGRLRIGYQKEPFSLDRATSSQLTTFMERSLADTLVPRHNVGGLISRTFLNQRVHISAGVFYDSDNFGNPRGGAASFTFRTTGVPIYTESTQDLLHLGFSYSRRNQTDDTARFQQTPESNLAPVFVDTGVFAAESLNVFGWEVAYTETSWLVQSEFVVSNAVNKDPEFADPTFWGGYVEVSYSLSGKQKKYKLETGIFDQVQPERRFQFRGKGSWDVGVRLSRIDLNDKRIRGGVLTDWTLGLNWMPGANTRIQWDYVRSRLQSVGTAHIFQMRFQIFF